jgi:hypothetical protein
LTSALGRSAGGSLGFADAGAGAFFSTGGKPSNTGSTRNGVRPCASASPERNPARPQQTISASDELRKQGMREIWAFISGHRQSADGPGVKIAAF